MRTSNDIRASNDMRTSNENVARLRQSADNIRFKGANGYAHSEVSSVPPPALLTPPPSGDGLQDLITRMREAKKMRTRFHLTETDCALMCTNAKELTFASGSVIVEEGAPINSIYRIKKGLVSLNKSGTKIYDLSAGHFIGEGLFIRGDAQDKYGSGLVANGQVVLSQLNLEFVRKLLFVDKLLAFKIYRHIACKLSGLVVSVIAQVTGDSTSPFGSPRGHLSSDVSMIRLDPETVTSLTGTEPISHPAEVPFAMVPETIASSNRTRKLRTSKSKTGTFKRYQLENSAMVKLTDKKITIKESTFKTKRKIKYNKILDISKTGSTTITIIYGVQAKTITFKFVADFHEFYGLVQSLISASSKTPPKQPRDSKFAANVPMYFGSGSPYATSVTAAALPPSGSTAVSSRQSISMPNPLAPFPHEELQVVADKQELLSLAVRQDLKKGDIVIAEGDLYQRIYTVVSGKFEMKRGGRTLADMAEGDVFGVITLFHLRPSILSIEVASDTATLLVIPGYRIHELVNTNFELAVRVFKTAAQQIYEQIEKMLTSQEGVARGLTESHFLL